MPLEMSPLLPGGLVSSGLLAGDTVTPRQLVSPAGPAQQADGAASALCCRQGHSRVRVSVPSRGAVAVPSCGWHTAQSRIYSLCGPPFTPLFLPPASMLRSGCSAGQALTGPFLSLSVPLVLQECRTWTGLFEQHVEQMEAGPRLWPGGGSTQQAEAGHGKLRRGSWLCKMLLPLHLKLKQSVSMAVE